MAGEEKYIPSDSAKIAFAITPHDTNDLAYQPRWLYVGTAGTLSVVLENGATVSFGAVTAGSLLPIRPMKVRATGTGASNIVGLL